FSVLRTQGVPVRSYVGSYGAGFQDVVVSRQRALGSSASGQINDKARCSIAASFLSQLSAQHQHENNFIAPPGLDLSPVLEQGGAVVLAWSSGYSPIKPMYQFSPRRSQRDTLWRVAVQLGQ
ncbi:MAG TPA: hypothetical protein VEC99_11150, partial [Clostridia bacterium]|nr:hypothetical protein [Clostridia bacterium]